MSKKNARDSEVKGFQLRKTPATAASGEPVVPDVVSSPDLDALGDLPHSYGSDTLFLIAQEPHWLFTYWDIDISRHPGGLAHLRIYRGHTLENEIEVPFESRNWYIPAQEAGMEYRVEIGYYRGGKWQLISSSTAVQTPPDKLSNAESFEYASIPLHLSFQRMTESIGAAVRAGEPLLETVARLQKENVAPGGFVGAISGFDLSQKMLLEALLGADLLAELSSGGLSSAEIESRILSHLEEKLSSQGGASELLGSEYLSSAGLSSTELTGLFAEEYPSSWNVAELSSWAASTLSSYSLQESLSSWGQEVLGRGLSSWSAATSWSGGEQSSWGGAAESSWNAGSLSSWLGGAEASWLQATSSSWNEAALASWQQAALTSWTEASLSSWGAASEYLSSFGQNREFFMHVNAEVIFYGGTDPRASVTVDGHPIKLNPDGSFRYHFRFPNDSYEIPIVAVSPDGVETRSAILKFERGTEKQGKVDDTSQPPLGVPMGKKS